MGLLTRWFGSKAQADHPRSFGYKTAWVAVKARKPAALAKALGLRSVEKCGWASGVDRSYEYERAVFVTPALNGWVLAAGRLSIGRFEDLAQCKSLLERLSRRFEEAQFFHSERVVDLYTWARAMGGTVNRCYSSVENRTICDEGARTEIETKLRIVLCHEVPNDEEFWRRTDITHVDEDAVARIAGDWSINPTELESAGFGPSLGLIGLIKGEK